MAENKNVKFKRNYETGAVDAYKDGKKVGTMREMGDDTAEMFTPDGENIWKYRARMEAEKNKSKK